MRPPRWILPFLLVSIVVVREGRAEEPSTRILRDEFGIPHIFAPTLEKAAFAAGYAQAEDRLEELLKNYRRASGTMAEVVGPAAFEEDLRQRVMRHADVSRARFDQVSPKMRGLIDAFHRGVRQFMKEHPEQVPPWAQELHPWDVIALGRYIIWNWPMGEAAGDLQRAGVDFGPLSYRGSNEMLIGPGRTAMKAPIAVIDPHVPWYDAIRFYQVRIYTPEYNAAGVCILGTPLPSLGHSRYCSVAMTTGGPDTSDIFEEEINPANPRQYRYDEAWRDLALRHEEIRVKGEASPRRVTLASSHHGPIVARKDGKAYAMAIPYADEVGLMDQCYNMFMARNLTEMKQALSKLQLMSQNVMVATIQGDIYYLRNGRVPIRPKGIDPGRPIAGNTSASEWRGIHPISDLLQIENPPGGWMQNCNCSPAAMMNRDQPGNETFAEKLYLYNDAPSPDTHQRAERVTDLLEAARDVTADRAIQIAFDTGVWRAERWQRRIAAAWGNSPQAAKSEDAVKIHELIRDWDRRADADSPGALAYYAFKRSLGPSEAARIEPSEQVTDLQILAALGQAAAFQRSALGELGATFGSYFRVGRRGGDRTWPVGGGSLHEVGMSMPRAISFSPSSDRKQMIGHTGQSATQVVVMTDPPESYAIIPLGESDHEESGHWDDQAEKLFSKARAQRVYFLRPDELKPHVTAEKVLNPDAP